MVRFDLRRDLSALMKERVNRRFRIEVQQGFEDPFAPTHSIEPVMDDCDAHFPFAFRYRDYSISGVKGIGDPYALKIAGVLALAGIILFGASLNDPFHFDDVLILNDANVTNPAQWAHFLNPLHLRQLTFFTFYLNHLIGGDNPAGYHVVNLALHIANAVLLFLLLSPFFERWVAVTAAAIFLIHPIQTEPVLYVYQRSILLACFFSLLGLMAFSEKRLWLAIGFFFLAFESKEAALAVPLALAMLYGGERRRLKNVSDHPVCAAEEGEHFINGAATPPLEEGSGDKLLHSPHLEEGWTRHQENRGEATLIAADGVVREKLWMLFAGGIVLAVGALGLLVYLGEKTVGIGAIDQVSPLKYFLAETRIVYTYLRLLIWPFPQSLEYEFPNTSGILPLLGILAMLAAAWWLARSSRYRLPGLCILAFVILLAPTSSIIPSADAAFEHRLYLPMLAFSLLTAYLLSKLPRRTWVGIALICILAVLTVRRGIVWSSDIALWEDTVKQAPGKARVWFNLGGAYLNVDPGKARPALLHALDLKPDFTEALYDLGVIEQGKGNWNTALAYYERAIEKDPHYWPAWNNMGNTLFSMGQHERALEYFNETLRLNTDYWPAQYNIAIVNFMSGRYEDALLRLRTVLDWRPDFREARYLLALTLTRAGDRSAADEEFKKLGESRAAEYRNTPAMISAPSRP